VLQIIRVHQNVTKTKVQGVKLVEITRRPNKDLEAGKYRLSSCYTGKAANFKRKFPKLDVAGPCGKYASGTFGTNEVRILSNASDLKPGKPT
jgi:hypothetical protein